MFSRRVPWKGHGHGAENAEKIKHTDTTGPKARNMPTHAHIVFFIMWSLSFLSNSQMRNILYYFCPLNFSHSVCLSTWFQKSSLCDVTKGQSFFSIQFSNARLSLMFKHSAWQMSTCLFLVICSFWVMNHTRLLHDYQRPEHGQLMALSFYHVTWSAWR